MVWLKVETWSIKESEILSRPSVKVAVFLNISHPKTGGSGRLTSLGQLQPILTASLHTASPNITLASPAPHPPGCLGRHSLTR